MEIGLNGKTRLYSMMGQQHEGNVSLYNYSNMHFFNNRFSMLREYENSIMTTPVIHMQPQEGTLEIDHSPSEVYKARNCYKHPPPYEVLLLNRHKH